jgi:hypothetical protein
MTNNDESMKWNYENLFKELYRDNKSEGIYLLLTENPEVMRYMTRDEKAGIAEGILRLSNEKIKNLNKKIEELENNADELDSILLNTKKELNEKFGEQIKEANARIID